MTTVTITRKSKIGFGYNTTPTGNGTEIEPTTHPDYIGTIKTVLRQKRNCPNFNANRNLYQTQAWFVKINNDWKKIDTSDSWTLNQMEMLLEKRSRWEGYVFDKVEVPLID